MVVQRPRDNRGGSTLRVLQCRADDEWSHKRSGPVGGFLNGEAPPRLRSVKSLRLQSLALLLRQLLVRAVQLEIDALLARLSLGFLRVRQAAGERGKGKSQSAPPPPREKTQARFFVLLEATPHD